MKDTGQHATFNLVLVSHVNKGHNGLYGDWLIVTKGEKRQVNPIYVILGAINPRWM